MKQKLLIVCAALAIVALPLAAQEPVDTTDPREAPRGQVTTVTGTVVDLTEDEMVVQTEHGRRDFQLAEHHQPEGIGVGDQVSVEFMRTEADVLVIQQVRRVTAPTPAETTTAPTSAETIASSDPTLTTKTGTVVEITEEELVLRTEVGLERFRVVDVQVPAGARVGDRLTVDFTRTPEDVMVVENVRIVTLDDAPAVLPATASTMPLVALLGLLALGAAAGLRLARH